MNFETAKATGPKKLAPNTSLVRMLNGAYAIVYYATRILTFFPDGTFSVNSGEWMTMSTKERINRFAPKGFCVNQKKGEWFYTTSDDTGNITSQGVFRDKMMFAEDPVRSLWVEEANGLQFRKLEA